MKQLNPTGKKVLIEVVELNEVTASGIEIVGGESRQQFTLIAIGPDCTECKPEHIGCAVEIRKGHFAGREIDGTVFMVGQEDNVLGTYPKGVSPQ